MGNALVCFEGGSWDSHQHVGKLYRPLPEPQMDMAPFTLFHLEVSVCAQACSGFA